jgi:hypothetical protein
LTLSELSNRVPPLLHAQFVVTLTTLVRLVNKEGTFFRFTFLSSARGNYLSKRKVCKRNSWSSKI